MSLQAEREPEAAGLAAAATAVAEAAEAAMGAVGTAVKMVVAGLADGRISPEEAAGMGSPVEKG